MMLMFDWGRSGCVRIIHTSSLGVDFEVHDGLEMNFAFNIYLENEYMSQR